MKRAACLQRRPVDTATSARFPAPRVPITARISPVPETNTIRVDSMLELTRLLPGASLYAHWIVRTQIGPGWTGGGREIGFSLGESTLDPTCAVHTELSQALIALLELPEVHEPEMIQGEGELTAVDGWLVLEYEYSMAVPYMDGKSFSGSGRLLPLAASG